MFTVTTNRDTAGRLNRVSVEVNNVDITALITYAAQGVRVGCIVFDDDANVIADTDSALYIGHCVTCAAHVAMLDAYAIALGDGSILYDALADHVGACVCN